MKATTFRFMNVAILVLVVVLTLTGLISWGWTVHGWVTELHRIASWALIALIPWKVFIAWRSLKRGVGKRPDRNVVLVVSVLLAAVVLTSITAALLWTWQVGDQLVWRRRLLWWHWILAFVALVPLAVHVWRRWPKPKQADFRSRRAFLQMAGLGALGVAGWLAAERLATARNSPATPRLITGSRLEGEYSGNAFPITSEAAPEVDLARWRLRVRGAVETPISLTVDELATYDYKEVDAILDCTNGWWTVQTWGGVPLTALLATTGMASNALAVRMTSLTGYTQVFTLHETERILVGTHVGGEPLSHWHGAPARVVVPGRRGWFWTKWLSEIVVLDSLDEVLVAPFSVR